jgi:hypothetical protein
LGCQVLICGTYADMHRCCCCCGCCILLLHFHAPFQHVECLLSFQLRWCFLRLQVHLLVRFQHAECLLIVQPLSLILLRLFCQPLLPCIKILLGLLVSCVCVCVFVCVCVCVCVCGSSSASKSNSILLFLSLCRSLAPRISFPPTCTYNHALSALAFHSHTV